MPSLPPVNAVQKMLKWYIWLHIMPSACVSVCVSGVYGCTLLLALFASCRLVFCGEALLNVKAQYKVKAHGGILLAKCKMLFLAHRDVIFVSSV